MTLQEDIARGCLESGEPSVVMEEKLLPCPFCGKPGAIQYIKETSQYYPRCTGGSGKFCLLTRYPDLENDGFILKVDAVKVWNRRENAQRLPMGRRSA